jgi:hypothetical protein
MADQNMAATWTSPAFSISLTTESAACIFTRLKRGLALRGGPRPLPEQTHRAVRPQVLHRSGAIADGLRSGEQDPRGVA